MNENTEQTRVLQWDEAMGYAIEYTLYILAVIIVILLLTNENSKSQATKAKSQANSQAIQVNSQSVGGSITPTNYLLTKMKNEKLFPLIHMFSNLEAIHVFSTIGLNICGILVLREILKG